MRHAATQPTRRENRQREERRAPRIMGRKPQPDGHAHDRRERKCRRHEGGAARPPRVGNDVGDDSEHDGADDAAEDPRDDARGEQQLIRRRHPAQRGRHDESRVHREQRALAPEPVDPERGDESADCGGEGVRGDEQAEVPRVDVEQPHELRRERHQDHEVEDVRELDAREGEQKHDLACGQEFGLPDRSPAFAEVRWRFARNEPTAPRRSTWCREKAPRGRGFAMMRRHPATAG